MSLMHSVASHKRAESARCAGAGSVLQLMVARGGNFQPPLFRAAMTSSTFLPQQFHFNDKEPEVGKLLSILCDCMC